MMITIEQRKEISNYLLAKKLPVDLMLEVQDHFISQIHNLNRKENLNFEESFASVKESWRKELTLSWKGEMSLMDSTDFMRKMSKEIVKSNVLESLKLVLPYILFLFLVANLVNLDIFKVFIIFAISIPLLYSLVNYIVHFKDFRLIKKYENQILTLHQDGILIFMLTISNWISIFSTGFTSMKQFLNMFIFNFENVEILRLIITFLGLLFILGGMAYSIVCQKNYLRQIKRVKLFLGNFQKIS